MIYWIFLGLAIATEVTGTVTMRAVVHHNVFLSQMIATVAISFSYFFLAKAVQGISLGIAYALWCGIGLACISLASTALFDESMPMMKIAGLVCVGIGAVLMKLGDEKKASSSPELEGAVNG